MQLFSGENEYRVNALIGWGHCEQKINCYGFITVDVLILFYLNSENVFIIIYHLFI